jgi:hypothetical protein
MREFELNGVIVLRGFLPAELIRAMHAELTPLYEAARRRIDAGEVKGVRNEGRYRLTLDPLLAKAYGALFDDRVRRNPTIEELARRILGPFGVGKTVVETTESCVEVQPWHADTVDQEIDRASPKRTTRLAFVVPLVDVTPANGPTDVILGSHHVWGFDCASWIDDVPVQASSLCSTVGDCFLRDGDIIHRGTPNPTATPRPIYNLILKKT